MDPDLAIFNLWKEFKNSITKNKKKTGFFMEIRGMK
jgi:hypothetical protein